MAEGFQMGQRYEGYSGERMRESTRQGGWGLGPGAWD